MPAVARLTDIWSGICCCHPPIPCVAMTGQIITGSPNIKCENKAQARLTDMTIGNCGHTGFIVTSSSTVFANNLGKALLGSQVVGCNIGQVVTGSPTYTICDQAVSISVTIIFQGITITYTEVDFGNIDDEQATDDGLNIYPPVVGRPPTPVEISKSAAIDVSPTVVDSTDVAPSPPDTAPPVTCTTVADPPPDNFQLSPNFILSDLSSKTALSKNRVRAQHGLTVQDIVCNHQAWAENIGEALSTAYGRANILVTSGFRVGASTSQHERGQACDLQFPTLTLDQNYAIAQYIKNNLNYDQLIWEYGGNRPWLHISFNRAGNRPNTAPNKFGTRTKAGSYVWGELRKMH
jgi:uncharacterized Zn-binding protein involved in type VI secretion